MAKRICAQCGGEVVGKKCFKRNCLDYWQNYWDKKVQEKIPDYQKEVELLQTFATDVLNLEDYSKLKKTEKEVKKWESELRTDSEVKSEVEQLLKNIEELETKFPEKIKLKYKGKSEDCFHKNIHWLSFFQEEITEEPYCLDCGEDENLKFTKSFQKWYCKKVKEWLRENKLKDYRFTNIFLKKNNFYDKWWSLERGEEFENIKDEFLVFQEMNKLIEEYLLEFAEEQENRDSNSNNSDKNQESRIKNQESRIKNQESTSNFPI